MKPVLMALTAATIAGAQGVAASPLSRYVDHARVLVISAPAAGDPELRRQDAALGAQASGLEARHVMVVRAVGAAAYGLRAGEAGAADVRTAVGLPANLFGIALVGKDGGVKLRRREPISTDELFGLIDAMPMRRNEMRRDEMRRDEMGRTKTPGASPG